jgi:tRNA(adenine34) deaminase
MYATISLKIAGLMLETDEKWMRVALAQAERARDLDEIPIGACLIDEQGDLISTGYNRTISDNDPTAHAEIIALREAAKKIGNYRLPDVTVYTTVEPCAMCAGALVNARVKRLVYGAEDKRFGAVNTHFGIGVSEILNHRIDVVPGVLADECQAMMQEFFRAKRAASKPAAT